jgi:fused signal recognition particle receptor
MGLFSKIKNMFKKDNDVVEEEKKELEQEVEDDEEEIDESIEKDNEVEEIKNEETTEDEEESDEEMDESIEEDNEVEEIENEETTEDEEESDEEIDESIEEDNGVEEIENEETTEDEEESDEEIDESVEEDNEVEDSTDDSESEQVDEKEETVVEKPKKNIFGFKKKEKVSKEDKIKEEVKVYEKGLSKSREGFVSKLANLTNKYKKITEEYFEELEEILIMADIGVNTVMDFMDRLRARVKSENITDPSDLKEIIVDELFIIYVNDEVLSNRIKYNENGPTVILFVGVNGVGKTTTIAKIANKLKDEDKKVLLVGADTFRAGAVSQLQEWSEKVGTGFFGKEQSDPASVVYDGIVKAKEENYDVVLVDTAGRLQNKVNLMKELEKMNKVIDGLIDGGASETLLVIDATTGQNGISQAKAFKEITNITGIVLTKLDGTAKGGIVLAIKEEVGIPVKYIGLGERKEDLQVFDIEKYIYGLFKDMM